MDADHVHYGVPDGLLRDLHPTLPLRPPLEVSELNGVTRGVPVELDVESVVTEPRGVEPYFGLPLVEVVNPRLEVLSVVPDNLCIRHAITAARTGISNAVSRSALVECA